MAKQLSMQLKGYELKILFIIYPFCSIFIIVGAALSIYTLLGIWKARTVKNWPTAEASITECEFETHSDSEGADSHEVVVKYTYNVIGREYEGNRIHPAYSASSFEGHKRLYDNLCKAEIVVVRYNQDDPSESYLLSGNFSSHLAAFFGGMIFFCSGVFFLLTFHFAIAGNSDYASALEVLK